MPTILIILSLLFVPTVSQTVYTPHYDYYDYYDYSSLEAFEMSFAEQCEEYGVKEKVVQKAVVTIIGAEYGKDAAKIAQINDKEEQEEASLELMKKAIGNRSPMELIEYVENEYGK